MFTCLQNTGVYDNVLAIRKVMIVLNTSVIIKVLKRLWKN